VCERVCVCVWRSEGVNCHFRRNVFQVVAAVAAVAVVAAAVVVVVDVAAVQKINDFEVK